MMEDNKEDALEGTDPSMGKTREEIMMIAVEALSQVRAMRDQCREGEEAQLKLTDGVEGLWLILKDALASWRRSDNEGLSDDEKASLRKYILACLEFLANLTAGNATTCSLIWEAFFPDRFMDLLETLSRDRRLLMCICAILHNFLACSIDKDKAVNDLLAFSPLLCKLLRIVLPPATTATPTSQQDAAAATEDEEIDPVFEWVYFTTIKIMEAKQGRKAFKLVGVRLSSSLSTTKTNDLKEETDMDHFVFTPEQLVFLHLLEHTLGDTYTNGHQHVDTDGNESSHLTMDGGELLIELIERVKRFKASSLQEGDQAESMMMEEAVATVVRILGAPRVESNLIVVRSLRGTGGVLAVDHVHAIRNVLIEAGAVEVLVEVLAKEGGRADGDIPLDAAPRPLREGRKAEAIRALGNLCHRCRRAQDLVREKGAIPLILSHCNVDSSNPFLREWSLLAVRNLCEGNLENQQAIEIQKPQGTITSKTLRTMGIEPSLTVDAKGKTKVIIKRVDRSATDDDGGGAAAEGEGDR